LHPALDIAIETIDIATTDKKPKEKLTDTISINSDILGKVDNAPTIY